MSDHSPTPWKIDKFRRSICVRDASGNVVIGLRDNNSVDGVSETYARVVRAVNCHEALVEALREALYICTWAATEDGVTDTDANAAVAKARAALALVDRGGQP